MENSEGSNYPDANTEKKIATDIVVSREKKKRKLIRVGFEVAGGAIPVIGGFLSAAAAHWSEQEQEKINNFLKSSLKMLQTEMDEQYSTVTGILSRIDVKNEHVQDRISSPEFQSLMRKAFRNWAGAESEKKRILVRNILSNDAESSLVSDDIISIFLDWLHNYSEFHFAVIGEIYQNPGVTRSDIWRNLGKGSPREDSAEADLFKLLFRDLATGSVIRQHREVDNIGKFVKKPRKKSNSSSSTTYKSAFDSSEPYELTALGRQFVHYAMNELTQKIAYDPEN